MTEFVPILRPKTQGPSPKSVIFRQLARALAPQNWGEDMPALSRTDWIRVIEASSHHRVTPSLSWRVVGRSLDDVELEEYLDAILHLNRARNDKLGDALDDLGQRLNAIGQVPLLLKGAAYLASGAYPDRGMRFQGDLDILLPEDQLLPAEAILQSQGYQSNIVVIQSAHQLPMLVHPEQGVGIELHRYPVRVGYRPIIDEADVRASAVEIRFRNSRFLIPSVTHLVTTALVHDLLMDGRHAHGVPGLRAMLDVALLQHRRPDEIMWEEVAKRFAAAQLETAVYDFLALGRALMGISASLASDETRRGAIERMDSVLERTSTSRMFRAGARIAVAAGRKLFRPRAELLDSLGPGRWKMRLSRYNVPW